jgi:ABC-type nickel/cobalt efflux system permease component RcnA
MRLLIPVLLSALVAARPADLVVQADHAGAAEGICPSFSVRCVLDGDWVHPVGSIGNKRGYDEHQHGHEHEHEHVHEHNHAHDSAEATRSVLAICDPKRVDPAE